MAPVLPADTTAAASPSATALTARTSDDPGFERTASTGDSSISIRRRLDELQPERVDACWSEEDGLDLARRRRRGPSDDLLRRPVASEGVDRDANGHPPVLLRSLDPERLDLAALVRLAVRAHAVRELRLPAGRTDLDARDGDPVLRATLVAPRPGRFPLRDGHERPRSIPTGESRTHLSGIAQTSVNLA